MRDDAAHGGRQISPAQQPSDTKHLAIRSTRQRSTDADAAHASLGQALRAQQAVPRSDQHVGRLTEAGGAFLTDLDIDPQPGGKRRGAVFCRPCLDWSERRPHIAGQVGAALCRACLDRDWVGRVEGSRALTISSAGRLALDHAFGGRLLG